MTKIITSKIFSQFPEIKHGFFTRIGGVSKGIYNSLNLGYGSADLKENIDKNYQIIANTLNIPRENIITLRQIHSNKIVTASNWDERPEADGLITTKKNIALGILTADCLPIIFYDPQNKIISAVHAGWKGAFSGIITNVINKMISQGSLTKNIHAAILPSIIQNSYEVDQKFYNNFCQQNQENSKFFTTSNKAEHFMFDLRSYAKQELENNQIMNIDDVSYDTLTNEKEMFSYRRSCLKQQIDMGRHLSFILLNN